MTHGQPYMFATYGEKEWNKCRQELEGNGLTPEETETWLYSKHMRWASDWSGECTSEGMLKYLHQYYPLLTQLKQEAQDLLNGE